MESNKCQEKVSGRFEKVLRYYWDGVPVPLLCSESKLRSHTFVCRRLAFTPDYHGETVEIPLELSQEKLPFKALRDYVDLPQPISCRIGSHYSPLVGFFCFDEGKRSSSTTANELLQTVRVPVECCDEADARINDTSMIHRRIRTVKMVSLYKPLIKEYSPLSRRSLRNILIIASKGCTSVSKEIIAREICDVNEDYATAESEAIFYYMCLNPLFSRILAPLQLALSPEPVIRSIDFASAKDTPFSRQHFIESRQSLQNQPFWNKNSYEYFRSLESLWETKFSRLRFVRLDVERSCLDVTPLLNELSKSMSSVISRLRIEFYTSVEELFFTCVKSSRDVLLMNEKEYEESVLRRIFVATEVFFVKRLRALFFDAMDELIRFFDCGNAGGGALISKRTRRTSSIRVELVASDDFQPRAPSFSLLLFGVADLFEEIEKSINGLPRLANAILRTMKLGNETLNIVSHIELMSYRSAITAVLDDASILVDKTLASFNEFCAIPVQNLTIVKTGSNAEVSRLIRSAQQTIANINHTSRDELFYGRFAIICTPLRRELVRHWEDYLAALISTYQNTITVITEGAQDRSRKILAVLRTTPTTVDELEQYLHNTHAAKTLADDLRATSFQEILGKVSCIESLFVPVEEHVCRSVFEFKKLPDELLQQAKQGSEMQVKCRSLLQRQLDHLCGTVRSYCETLSTGVKELYHMFNFDTCDIAAQTCAELRKLVVRIGETKKRIEHDAKVLGLPFEDSSEEYLLCLNSFEVVEQFWTYVFESTKLRELYSTPVSAVNANLFIERVREWRRLIHSSVRGLRAFPALVRLGREQEVALAKFEELELFLELITSPGLRKNHWRDIAKLISTQLKDDITLVINMSVTVRRLLDAGLLNHISAVAQIAAQARCDYEVENGLEEMRSYAKRTHFILESSSGPYDLAGILPSHHRNEILGQLEEYVRKCRVMRRRPNLGPPVQNSVDEWVNACEKSRDTHAAWGPVAERWIKLRPCRTTLRSAVTEGICTNEEMRLINQSLMSASDAYKKLCTVLKKPQFSLYTAMMQDTLQDFLLTIKIGVDDATELLQQLTERRRAFFTRYHFLSDSELLNFHSVDPPQMLVHLLPVMYRHLASVTMRGNEVVGIVATDGATLPLTRPLELSKEYPDVWMQRFDRTMRAAVLSGVLSCISDYSRCNLESWVRLWCGQITVLALRVLHTEGLRRSLQIAGLEGLRSYLTKTSDLRDALSIIAQGASDEGSTGQFQQGYEAVVAAALAYMQFAVQETELAVGWHVSNLSELESTRVLQTFLTKTNDGIFIRMAGVEFNYGLEFLGHCSTPMMSASQWVQLAPMMVDLKVSQGIPLARGGDEVGEALEAAASLMGCLYYPFVAPPHVPRATLLKTLRGCAEVGAFVYLNNCESLPNAFLVDVVLPLATANAAPRISSLWRPPGNAPGELSTITVHPLFRIVLAAAEPNALSRSVQLACRRMGVGAFHAGELLHDFLVRAGVIPAAPVSTEEVEFTALYQQLQVLHPTVFTIRRLRMVLCEAFASSDISQRTELFDMDLSIPLRLLSSLMTALGSIVSAFLCSPEGVALRRNVEAQVRAGLLLPSCRGALPAAWCEAPLEWSTQQQATNTVLARFDSWMEVHRRVLLVGPHFSGKTRLWKTWAGSCSPLIFSPPLISASEFYGTSTEPGFLHLIMAQLKESPTDGKAPLVVMEDVDATSSFELFVASWSEQVRARQEEVCGSRSIIKSLHVRVVGTAQNLNQLAPNTLDRFALMALAAPSGWEEALSFELRMIPDAKWAAKVLEKLLPPLVERAAKASPGFVGSSCEKTNMYAMAQRAAALCSRWYKYALTLHIHPGALELRGDEDEVPLRLFAVRCAVMAAVWSVGLTFPLGDRDAVKLSLLGMESEVTRALAECDLPGDLFPMLSQNSINPLEQVVLPRGWMSFEEAAKRTDLPLAWSGHCSIDSQLPAWSQVFPTPSRKAVLQAVECLINCGQHVLLHANAGSGKSTLLRTMKTNVADWVVQVHDMNGGMQPTRIQKAMTSVLIESCDGRHSPTLARRLVVCIDDLHLSPPLRQHGVTDIEERLFRADGLIRFCGEFEALSTPATGTISTANVVFCATKLLPTGAQRQSSSGAISGCVDVRLPDFDNDEMATGVYELCNAAAFQKRAQRFVHGCATFLDLIHGAYAQLRHRSTVVASHIVTPVPTLGPITPAGSQTSVASSSLENSMTNEDNAVVERRSFPSFFAVHLREALEALELLRTHLLNNTSDAHVATRVFLEVTAFYADQLHSGPPKLSTLHPEGSSSASPSSVSGDAAAYNAERALRQSAVQAAESSLQKCVRGVVKFSSLATLLQTSSSPDVMTSEDESFVADCIAEFSDAANDEREEEVCELEERRGSSGAIGSRGRFLRSETRCISVVLSYPDSLSRSTVRSDASRVEGFIRRASSSAAPTTLSIRNSLSTRSGSVDALGMAATRRVQPLVRLRCTPTYQTTWLTTRLAFLHTALEKPRSHAVLLGENTFGLRRLFRLWCANTHVPFVWFRVDPTAPPIEVDAAFYKDLRSIIRYACMNSIHLVLYLPLPLLRMPGVLQTVDLLVRSGDVSALFSDEERYSLMRGFRTTHSRSLKSFALADDTDLRERLRSSLNFIFHLSDIGEMHRVASAYPFLLQSRVRVLPLSSAELQRSLVREMTLALLSCSGGADEDNTIEGVATLDDEDADSKEEEELTVQDEHGIPVHPLRLSQRSTCTALCSIFHFVRDRHPTSIAQLPEFVAIYRDLNAVARARVLESARTGLVIMRRGDEAVKLAKAGTQRAHEAADEMAAAQTRIALLTEKLEAGETHRVKLAEEAQMVQGALHQTKQSLEHQRTTLAEAKQKAEERMEKATKSLRKVKLAVVRAIAVSRTPDKGPLLVRAIYAALEEELPKGSENPHELWSTAMKRMCTKEFTTALTQIAPVRDATVLAICKPYRQALDAIRYAPALPYAQLLADFFVAWVDYGKFRLEDYEAGAAEIVDLERRVTEGEMFYESWQKKVLLAEMTVEETRREIERVQQISDALQQEQRDITAREESLMKYTGLVDRFSRYLAEPADVVVRSRHARCVAADTLLVSAFYALLAMHPGSRDTYASLQRHLIETVHPLLHSTDPHDTFLWLLYQTHTPRIRALMPPGNEHFPWELTALFALLLKRTAWRWTLIGGANVLLEQELCKYLSLTCTGCIVISILDPSAKEQLTGAMRSGEGVLLRDVNDVASLDFVRYLNLLYCQLKKRWCVDTSLRKRSAAPRHVQSHKPSTLLPPIRSADDDAPLQYISFVLEGRDVQVHPSFFMVCTSTVPVSPETHAAHDALNVYNICYSPNLRLHYECLLREAVSTSSVSARMSSMREEVVSRQQGYFRCLQDFIHAHDMAAKLLAADIRVIEDGRQGDALVVDAEQALGDVELYEVQLTQTVFYAQSWQKVVMDSWEVVLPALEAVATFAEHIETEKLRRPWHISALDGCLSDIVRFPPVFLRRFAPQPFSDLTIAQKCFFAVVNYVQHVVERLAAGWPVPVRGLYSLLLLTSAMRAVPGVFTISSCPQLLKPEQTKVLQTLFRDVKVFCAATSKDPSAEMPKAPRQMSLTPLGLSGQEMRREVQAVYLASGDTLLRNLIRRESDDPDEDNGEDFNGDTKSPGNSQFYVAHLFSALAELHVEQANHFATSLYDTFMETVSGVKNVAPAPKRPQSPGSVGDEEEGSSRRTAKAGPRRTALHKRMSSDPGSSDDEDKNRNSGDAATRELVPIAEQIQRAAKAHQPLCVITHTTLNNALSWFRYELEEAKFEFQWRELTLRPTWMPRKDADVDSKRVVAGSMVMEIMMILASLSRQCLLTGRCNACLAVVADVAAATTGASTAELSIFREEWHQMLAYYSYSLQLPVNKAGGSICLALICSPQTEQVLWGGMSPGTHGVPCCYIPLNTATPQQRLMELLQPSHRYFQEGGVTHVFEAVSQMVAAELSLRKDTRKSNKTTRLRGPTLAKLAMFQSTSLSPVALPPPPSSTSSAALFALQKAMEELCSCVKLLHYEILVSHVACQVREQLSTGDGTLDGTVNDPTSVLQLYDLISTWCMENYRRLIAELTSLSPDDVPSPRNAKETSMSDSVGEFALTKRESVHSVLHFPSPSHAAARRHQAEKKFLPYGLKAYYYLRRRQPTWQLLIAKHLQLTADAGQVNSPTGAEAAEEQLAQAVLSVMGVNVRAGGASQGLFSVGNGSGLHNAGSPMATDSHLHSDRSRQRAAQCKLVEHALVQLRTGLFVLARQFAAYYMSPPHESGFRTPIVELQARQTMFRALIGIPEHDEEVQCLWKEGDMEQLGDAERFSLVLSIRGLDTFRAKVSIFPSALMELCGEVETTKKLYRERQQNLISLCFAKRSDSVNPYPLSHSASVRPMTPPADTTVPGLGLGTALVEALRVRATMSGLREAHLGPEQAVLAWEASSLHALTMRPLPRPAAEEMTVQMLRTFTCVMTHDSQGGTAETRPHSHVWLPSLLHPAMDLEILTTAGQVPPSATRTVDGGPNRRRGSSTVNYPFDDTFRGNERGDYGCHGNEYDGAMEGTAESHLIVVVTRRCFLLPYDVVLTGARLSPSLQRQILAQTQWSTSGNGNATSAESRAADDSAATAAVVAIRKVLLRTQSPHLRADTSLSSIADARTTLYTVGMRMWCTATAEPRIDLPWKWRWASVECARLFSDTLLWDTAPLCVALNTASLSAPSNVISHAPTPPSPQEACGKVFFTELQDGEGEEAATAAPKVDAVAWCARAFSEVPIPVQWRPIQETPRPARCDGFCTMELFLCVESQLRKPVGGSSDDSSSNASSASSSALGATSTAAAPQFILEPLRIREALDTYIWIAPDAS